MLHEQIDQDEIFAAKCRRLGLEPWGSSQPPDDDGKGKEEENEEMEEVFVENEEHERKEGEEPRLARSVDSIGRASLAAKDPV